VISKLPSNQNYPVWAKWIAQDQDGTWWVYQVEPLQSHNGWYENEVGFIQQLCKDKPVDDWRQALHKITAIDNTNNKA